MFGNRLPLPWLRRKDAPAPPVADPPPAPPQAPPAPPLARPAPRVRHEWLTITVARANPQGPVPLAHARVVVRPWPAGQPKPSEPLARTATGSEGNAALLLPTGRYAIAASHGGAAKAVTLTLDHAGRAFILLEGPARLAALAVEGATPLCEVEVRDSEGGLHARARADEHGFILFPLLPGTYDVTAAGATARVRLDEDARVRLPAILGGATLVRGIERASAAPAPARPYAAPEAGPDATRWN